MSYKSEVKKQDILVSVIVSVRNAEDYIAKFIKDLSQVLSAHFNYYEIIIVDDGSEDKTVSIVESSSAIHKNIQLYSLTQSRGVDIATVAGLDKAVGDFMVVMRPRCDPPSLIPKMIEIALLEKAHVVYALPEERIKGRGIYHAAARRFFNFLTRMSNIEVPAAVSSYRLFSRSVLNFMLESVDRHRIVTIAQAMSGYSYSTINYRQEWLDGKQRESIRLKTIGKAASLTISTSAWPLRYITLLSLAVSCLAVLYAVYVLMVAFLKDDVAPGWASLSLQISGLFFLAFIILAVMSEYLMRITETTSRRPLYYIAREKRSSVMDYLQPLNVEGTDEASLRNPGGEPIIPLSAEIPPKKDGLQEDNRLLSEDTAKPHQKP